MMRRCLVLIDGQNLFHAARREFGYTWPNFDAGKLARLLSIRTASALCETRFYSGVPPASVDPWWHVFWANKCSQMARDDITTVTRTLRVHTEDNHTVLSEKGIDLRIGLDMVRAAHEGEIDLMILVSRDTDFVEAIRESRLIAYNEDRWLSIASAYPDRSGRLHGIYQTTWLPISAVDYAACLDERDYRPSDSQLQAVTRLGPTPEQESQNFVQWPHNRLRPRHS
jgi:uncharacterized LabA/DUF88 family protein